MVHTLIILDVNAISAGTKFRKHYSEVIKNYPEADIYAQRVLSRKKAGKVNYLNIDTPGNVHFVEVTKDITIALAVTRFANHGTNTHTKECKKIISDYINNNYKVISIHSYHPERKIQGNFDAEYYSLF